MQNRHFVLETAKAGLAPAVWLVQRMKHHGYQVDGPGIDAAFSLEYMGSAEFEFGSLPKSLRAMREADLGKATPVPLRVALSELRPQRKADAEEFVAWYVGPEKYQHRIREFFRLELEGYDGPEKPYLKERTNISRAYGTESEDRDRRECQTIGWWDIGNHWAMFKTKKDARRFLDGLNNPPADSDAVPKSKKSKKG